MGQVATRVVRMSIDAPCPARLFVRKRYEHAITTIDESNRIVTLLTMRRLGGPRAFILEAFPRNADTMIVRRSNDCIRVADNESILCVDEATEVFETSISPNASFSNVDKEMMRAFLKYFAPAESLAQDYGKNDAVHHMLNNHLSTLKRSESLPIIAGYGRGMTPGTDDYLLGLHAGLARMSVADRPRRRVLHENIEASIIRTTETSGVMLRDALAGSYPEVLVRYCTDPSPCNLLQFIQHGATSGFDMILGLLAACSLAENDSNQHR